MPIIELNQFLFKYNIWQKFLQNERLKSRKTLIHFRLQKPSNFNYK